MAQLGFFEVGLDPDLLQRHDGHQRRAGRNVLAHLHRALRNHAVDGRGQEGAGVGQPGFAQLVGGLPDIGVVRDRGARGQGLVGFQLGLRCGQGGLRLGHARLGRLDGGLGMQDFLAADAARWVRVWRRFKSFSALARSTWATLDIGLAHGNVGFKGVVLHKQCAGAPHRLGQRRFSLFQRNIGVGGIQFDQRRAFGHQFSVVGLDADDRAGYL